MIIFFVACNISIEKAAFEFETKSGDSVDDCNILDWLYEQPDFYFYASLVLIGNKLCSYFIQTILIINESIVNKINHVQRQANFARLSL